MDLFHSIILGIVEGVTEFLPISSTGHLILTSNFLRIPQTDFVKTFEVVIQSGAILAVIVLYRKTILSRTDLDKKVIAAFIPTAAIGFFFYKFIKSELLGNPDVVLISLVVGGVVLIGIELLFKNRAKNPKPEVFDTKSVSYKKAFVIGLFQAISVVPGVSRAASTIIGGMILGLPRKTAVEFSFLLAIPTMIAATALDLKETSINFAPNEWISLSIGFATSFVVALLAIKWLVKYVETNNFILFGVYRIAFSVLYFIFILN